MSTETVPRPWHRERWPWLLMAGPAIVVVAGIATTVVAFRGFDGMVADDYYKRGLAINRTLAREARAASMGLTAEVNVQGTRAVAAIAAREALPERIQLTLAHPTRSGADRVVFLARRADGRYEAPVGALSPGRWSAILETPEWRWSGLAKAGS